MLGARVFPEGVVYRPSCSKPSQRGMDWLYERLEAPKAYKVFQQTRHQEALQKPWNMKDVFKVFVNLGAYHV